MSAKILLNGSPLQRQSWLMNHVADLMLRDSYTLGWRGPNSDAMVHNIISRKARSGRMDDNGHIVNLPFTLGLHGAALMGDGRGVGRGEILKQLNSRIHCQRFRKSTNVANAYDAQDAGNNFDEVSYASRLLTEYFVKWEDQWIFDALSGIAIRPEGGTNGGMHQRPSHGFIYGSGSRGSGAGAVATFGYDALNEIETAAMTGSGFHYGDERMPMGMPGMYRGKGMKKMARGMMRPVAKDCLYFVCDKHVTRLLKSDSGFQNVMQNADMRGDNVLIRGLQGFKQDSLKIIEVQTAHGRINDPTRNVGLVNDAVAWGNNVETDSAFERDQVEVSVQGLRQFDGNGYWSGQENFGVAQTGQATAHQERWSRCYLLGMNAVQLASSTIPWVATQSEDHGDEVSVQLQNFLAVQKTILKTEKGGELPNAPVADIDFGAITVDIRTQ